MIEKCKIQIGDMLVDAEIDIEYKLPQEEPPKDDPIKHMRAFLAQFPLYPASDAYNQNYKVVEGSVVHPIDEPGRLIDSPED